MNFDLTDEQKLAIINRGSECDIRINNGRHIMIHIQYFLISCMEDFTKLKKINKI